MGDFDDTSILITNQARDESEPSDESIDGTQSPLFSDDGAALARGGKRDDASGSGATGPPSTGDDWNDNESVVSILMGDFDDTSILITNQARDESEPSDESIDGTQSPLFSDDGAALALEWPGTLPPTHRSAILAGDAAVLCHFVG